MFIAFREHPKSNFYQRKNDESHLTSDSKTLQRSMKPDGLLVSIPIGQFSTILSSKELFGNMPQSVINFTKKWILYTQAEDIWESIDDKLKFKISEDQYLGRILLNSLVGIKKYLEKTKKRYELNASIWNDIENKNWEENIISIRIEYYNNEEKRKVWNEIDRIVRKYDKKRFSIITEIKKL